MRRVLLVDDDPRMTHWTHQLLSNVGFDVEVTNRAFGVLNLIAQRRPDVVVMDVHMPGLRGTELVELLRDDAELAGTKVVLFSGVVEPELARLAAEAGADGFLHKTAHPRDLIRLVRAA